MFDLFTLYRAAYANTTAANLDLPVKRKFSVRIPPFLKRAIVAVFCQDPKS